MSDALYSSEILRLAADIPHIGRLARPDGSARLPHIPDFQ